MDGRPNRRNEAALSFQISPAQCHLGYFRPLQASDAAAAVEISQRNGAHYKHFTTVFAYFAYTHAYAYALM